MSVLYVWRNGGKGRECSASTNTMDSPGRTAKLKGGTRWRGRWMCFFLCFDILVFASRLEVGSGGLVKGMYRSKEVVFRNKKKEGQRKGK